MDAFAKEFWSRHPGLVWSNPDAGDTIRIRAALLRPRFDQLLDMARQFGMDRLRQEWQVVQTDDTPEVRRAGLIVARILRNLAAGFSGRPCSGMLQAGDEGYAHLLPAPPSLEEIRDFFIVQRDVLEASLAQARPRGSGSEKGAGR